MAGISDPTALPHSQVLLPTAGVTEGFLDPVRPELSFGGQENFHKDAPVAVGLDGRGRLETEETSDKSQGLLRGQRGGPPGLSCWFVEETRG